MEMWFVLYMDSDNTPKTTKVSGTSIIDAVQNFHKLFPGLTKEAVRSCFSTRP